MSKKLPSFLRRLADKRKAEGDGIWELLLESAEHVEAVDAQQMRRRPSLAEMTEVTPRARRR